MTTMLPQDLKPESFRGYPPLAQHLLTAHLSVLQQLPLILLPILLREAIVYDWRFPLERRDLDDQLSYLDRLSKPQLDQLLMNLSSLSLSKDFEKIDWVHDPNIFVEKLTAHLWATHQMDKFHQAADAYWKAWSAHRPAVAEGPAPLGITIIGQGVESTKYPLFRKLRPHGVFFTQVSPEGGVETLLNAVAARAEAHPIPYGHWYIDGGKEMPAAKGVSTVSYGALEPVRHLLLDRMQRFIQSGSAGPEALRTMLTEMKPQDCGLPADGDAAVLSYFQMTLFTEGSGTQIFSTTFAQWAAREALRRAQPRTLLVRYAPRQRQRPMNELLTGVQQGVELDPEGSLIDADMGAYYTWLNQKRLAGADKGAFLVWFEGHDQALAIGPTLPGGTVSSTATNLKQILNWLA